MKRFVPVFTLVGLSLLVWASPARAQDEIYTKANKEKAIKGEILSESAKGIKLKGGDEIPAENIYDVNYEVNPVTVRLNAYRPATVAEKAAFASASEDERAKKFAEAIKSYEEALPKVDPKQIGARRHIEFKIIYLGALKAEEENKEGPIRLAIKDLKEFRTRYPESWQLSAAALLQAKLQVGLKEFGEAGATLQELADARVSEATRLDAQLMKAQLSIKEGKYDKAQAELKELAAKLPKDSIQGQRARLAQAEVLAASKNLPAAKDILKKFIAETKDRDMKAVAHNTLGYCYFLSGQSQDALWEFLWVDVVYNQNKTEHAKALYHLAKIFSQLNDPTRAQECLDTLINDRQFSGMDYQRLAMQENKN